ncbi:type I-E CRISPR-associated protein Cse2/CasB [Spirochaetia bacterium]|nr:type I-E CRISPR-associated protein Cse2/CasB [Spirochaetia bacterium]
MTTDTVEAVASKAKTKSDAFVEMVIERLNGKNSDAALGAALRRADNPATEYQSWEYLAKWCDIEKSWERKPFVLIGAALAKAKPHTNGNLGIGQAIARCYSDEGTYNGNEKDGAKAKLRRLLACDTTEEACDILRPLLSLISSRGVPLNYAGLLQDLLRSNEWFLAHIKPRWAKDFYHKQEEDK